MSAAEALHADYRAALERYLEGPGESTLEKAYEMGRRALASRLGLLELTLIHLEAARALDTGGTERRRQAEAFLLESLTPFEMTHRAFREATLALRRLNERIEDEAKRIAHALHDEAGALLATAHIAVEEVATSLPSSRRGGFARIREILVEIEAELRRLSHELRPTILDDLGLLPALDFLTKGVAGRTGLLIRVEGSIPGRLPPAIETTLYRVVQEALNTVVQHAHALKVTVSVRRDHAMVRCQVKDDGIGFEVGHPLHDSPERGLGLVGIQERVDSLHGTLRVMSSPGRGTELTMSLPLEV
jgi:signal transduction histidine kinase